MDLLTTRPRHRKQAQQLPQRRSSQRSTASTQNVKTLPKKPIEKKSAPPKKPAEAEIVQRKRIETPSNVPITSTERSSAPPERSSAPIVQIQRDPPKETKHVGTQTEAALIEKKLHDSLLNTVEDTLEIIRKNLQRILDDKSKSIEESYAKLIEGVLDKVDAKKHAKLQETKKVLEAKLKDYKNHVKQKQKLDKEKEKKQVKGEKVDNLRLKRQFSLEKLTKHFGPKESFETPKMKRQFSFENAPTKHQQPTDLDDPNTPQEDIGDLKSRLTKVMEHFKSTEMLNGHEKEEEIVQTVEEEPPVGSFPQEDQQEESTDAIFPSEDEGLLLPPEDFQEHPYDSKREQELEYLKSLRDKLSCLALGHRISESSSEASFQEKPDGKKNPNDTKKIKELRTKITQLVNDLKSPTEKIELEKAEKKLLKLKVKYINVRFVQEDEFQAIRSEVIKLFNEAERMIEAAKHGLTPPEENSAPRVSVTSECSSLDVSEASYTESPYTKLERLRIMLEQMASDIEEAEILNYDLIFNELNKYQEEFADIRTQLLPETAPIRQEVFNLLIQAYNLLEDKNSK